MSQSKKDRAESARQRAEQMRKEAEARSRRTRAIVIALTAVIVLALVGAAVVVVQNARHQAAEASKGPAGLSANGGLMVGDADAKVTVTEYLDFMCPICKQFESANSAKLDELKSQGKIKIEFVPVAILDSVSQGTEYSSRSASAGYCVMESDKDKFEDYLQALYSNQPEENSTGLTSTELAQIAASVKVSQAGQDCITSNKYTGYAQAQTTAAGEKGLQGTPYVLINGKAVENSEFTAKLDAAVAA